MSRTLVLDVAGAFETISEEFQVNRVYNIGSATRDPDAAKAHQDEVAKIGIRIAFDVPAPRVYPVSPAQLLADDEILVVGHETSGEVEIVLLVSGDLYIGVGSDHTDRALERWSIPWSKQVCPNVIAPVIWRWEDVAEHWDRCVLESDIAGTPYQRAAVDLFLSPEDILAILRDRIDLPDDGFAVFCGSSASIDETMRFGSPWTIRLIDPVRERRIEHTYSVRSLMDEIREGYRVPIVPDETPPLKE